MTEEVKKALAWWRERGDYYRETYRRDLEAIVLIDAFAELHPPDDDEPVTGEWLLANGWDESAVGLNLYVTFFESSCKDGLFAYVSDTGILILCSPKSGPLQHNPTRGQLRRLIAALES